MTLQQALKEAISPKRWPVNKSVYQPRVELNTHNSNLTSVVQFSADYGRSRTVKWPEGTWLRVPKRMGHSKPNHGSWNLSEEPNLAQNEICS
ncbi:unnamed protein product [Heligmosomoides polygyrus]|uniref:Transposase n=1 Tax=Heligmosomoides polygyrus TaxID=6339 RepID=A0A183G8J7_HELPZ|nr:unnamed protein product [Heligmosomoides polygyrus]